MDLVALQRGDSELAAIVTYLETRVLPAEEKFAKRPALTQSQDLISCQGRQHSASHSPLEFPREAIPTSPSRCFGAHLGDAKVHSELRRHYLWGMRADITRWTRGCLVCASYSTGQAVHALLTPIPVSGPFHRVRVDVIQFPLSHDGN